MNPVKAIRCTRGFRVAVYEGEDGEGCFSAHLEESDGTRLTRVHVHSTERTFALMDAEDAAKMARTIAEALHRRAESALHRAFMGKEG